MKNVPKTPLKFGAKHIPCHHGSLLAFVFTLKTISAGLEAAVA